MKVQRIDRNSPFFYALLGPVFGSRVIEQETHDRFYDDAGKIWFIIPGQGAASVLGSKIRNFWASTFEVGCALLDAMLDEYPNLDGIVPNQYEECFEMAGFVCLRHRKNFLEVHRHA